MPPQLLGGAAGGAPGSDGCKPQLLLVRGGRVVCRVQGANAPELEAQVADAAPAAAPSD